MNLSVSDDDQIQKCYKEQNWFKRAHIRHLGIAHIITSTTKLSEEDIRSQVFFQAEGEICSTEPPREDAQDHGIFISLIGALYVVVNSNATFIIIKRNKFPWP